MDPSFALEAEVAVAARAVGLAPGDRVLVAVSGGADSTALAALLGAARAHGLPLTLSLGHVDHGWRGPAEAAADRAVVAALAARLGVPLDVADPPTAVTRTEDAARRFRYAALVAQAQGRGAATIATAHHLRDQAETFLLRLARGSGPAGLAGIPARRPIGGGTLHVVRPLLALAPARLRAYLAARGFAFREDPTNAVLDRDRAKVRARLLDAERRDAPIARDLAATAARLRRALARREAAVGAALAPSLRIHPWAAAVEVSLDAVRRVPPGETSVLLRVLGRAIGADDDGPWFTRAHAALVARALGGADARAAVDLPRGRRCERHGARVVLRRADVATAPALALDGVGTTTARVGRVTVSLARADIDVATLDVLAWRRGARARGADAPYEALVDADRAGRVLCLRRTADGDRFTPLGRSRPVAVATFLAKAGVAAPLRVGAPIVVDAAGRTIWVVGHRIDAAAAIAPSTTRIAVLRVTTDLTP